MVPRDELDARVGELLETDPALTLARVRDELVAYSTAARVVPRLRGVRIADLVAGEEGLSLEQAAERLGYSVVRRAAMPGRSPNCAPGTCSRTFRRWPAPRSRAEGLAERQDVVVAQVADDVVAAAVVLSSTAPVPALV